MRGITLDQCLREHTKEEVLDDGNEWYCNICKVHKKAKKKVSFCKDYLPDVLILSLKRFEFRDVSQLVGREGVAHREKIDSFVDFPTEGLNMLPYCDEVDSLPQSSRNNTSSDILDENQPGTQIYDLFAVCNHYGRMGFGHYTAAARDMAYWPSSKLVDAGGLVPSAATSKQEATDGHWFCFDDRQAFACEVDEHVRTSSAYILFYRRRPL